MLFTLLGVAGMRTSLAAQVSGTTTPPEGALCGIFSIADNKYVLFSQGNLQYNGTIRCRER